jgi:putative DNA-invertase from lambdoid prophage Rac
MSKRVAIYARVSTADQTADNQLRVLRAWAESRGHDVVGEFVDVMSGRRESRPGLDRMRAACVRGEVQVVAAVALDRLGRSLINIANLLEDFAALGIDLYLGREGIDTSTPTGRALLGMAAVFAQLERDINVERTKMGLARARAQGKRLGRPNVPQHIARRVEQHLKAGVGQNRAATLCGVGKSVVGRIARELRAVA